MWLSTPKLVSTSFKTQSLEVLKLKYLSICEKMLDCEINKHRRVRGHCRPCTLQEKIGGRSNISLSFLLTILKFIILIVTVSYQNFTILGSQVLPYMLGKFYT